jgi:uridine phosphorylase
MDIHEGLPLLEGDFDAEGIIEPARVYRPVAMPERVVACFFGEVVAALARRPEAREVTRMRSESGDVPVWEVELPLGRLAVFQCGVGAPLAAAMLEQVIARGARRVVACGGAGALLSHLVLGHAVVVDSAVRDEGTSYHYLPAQRTIAADAAMVARLRESLDADDVAHLTGRTWTTDAIFRETRARTERRIAEGCVVVEMEAAALIAVARYRGVAFGHLLMAGDSLSGQEWDHRDWTRATAARQQLFWSAARAALAP